MTSRNRLFAGVTLPICAAILLAGAWFTSAGDLNPPAGPVAPTMKTLVEVEPRIAINAANTPGDADSLFKITQPGSYYLTGNITGVVGKHGIEIAAPTLGPGVSIDLMGFELVGVPGSLDGISATVASTRNIAIRNGAVRAWGGDGIDILNSQNNLLADLRAQANGARGILAGQGSTIAACTAQSNTGDGIFAGIGSTVTGCTVFVNTGDGIVAGQGSTVTGCTAYLNTSNGIFAGNGSTVAGCTGFDNTGIGILANGGSTVTGCTAQGNTVDGIKTFGGSTVTGCTAQGNTGDGIEVGNDCRVTDNTCDSNGNAGDGAGIHATGSDNRIEGNNCTGADRGIDVDFAGNIIIRNTCSGNTTNWAIVANNVCGPILDRTAPASAAINGNSAPDSTGSTHPNANFSY